MSVRKYFHEIRQGSARVYDIFHDKHIPAGKGHDATLQKARLKGLMGSRGWAASLPNCFLSTCCEFGYSLCGGVYSVPAARELGHSLLKAASRTCSQDN